MRLSTRAFRWCCVLTVSVISPLALDAHRAVSQESASSFTVITSPAEPSDRPAERYLGGFFDTTVDQALASNKVELAPEDKVYAFPDPALGLGSQISVYRAQSVVVREGGKDRLVRSWAKSVGEFLTEQGIEVGSRDIVAPAVAEPLPYQPTPLTITITRVAETEIELKYDIAFETTTKDDPTMEQGQSKTQTEGKPGVLKKRFLVRRENGVEISRTLLSQAVETPPVTKVVLKGTKPKVTTITSNVKYKDMINEAALKYSVPADKLYKLMMCESGGNPRAIGGGGLYKGLFQFTDSTWAHSGFSSYDIFDPWAQINATASLWGRRSSMWPACSQTL